MELPDVLMILMFFLFGSSVEVSAYKQNCGRVILLISIVYICPHTQLLRG